MSAPFVPDSIDEVTAGWLQETLGEILSDAVFESVVAERIGEAYGLASQIYRCRLAARGQPRSVVIKLWPIDSPSGTREVSFYRSFGSTVGARIPACFYAGADQGRKRGVLILEDLDPVMQGDCLQQLSRNRAVALAHNLAGMHARWTEDRLLHEAEWLHSIIPWEREASWFVPRRTLFLERFGERLNMSARALLWQIEQLPDIVNRRLAGGPITLLHAELHLDNIVFEGQAEPVILDWARCARGPGAFDLYNLLFDISRPQDIETVLQSYLDAYAGQVGVALDRTSLRHQLAGAFLYNFALATCGVARWQPASSREAAMIEVGIQRALHALNYWHLHDSSLFLPLA